MLTRNEFLNEFEAHEKKINNLIENKKLDVQHNILLSRVMFQLEDTSSGEVCRQEIHDALTLVANKPIDKKQIKKMADVVISGQKLLNREQVRNGLKTNIIDL